MNRSTQENKHANYTEAKTITDRELNKTYRIYIHRFNMETKWETGEHNH